MPDREAYYYRSALKAFERASAKDQQEYDRIVADLCNDPGEDPPLKTRLIIEPAVVYLYNDTNWWVIYDLPTKTMLEVWMIGKAPKQPRLHPAP